MTTSKSKFEIFKRMDGEYSWRLKAPNGQIIATSGVAYVTRSGAVEGARRVRSAMSEISVEEIG